MLRRISAFALAFAAACLLPFARVQAVSPETGITGTVSVGPALPGPQRAGVPDAARYRGALVQLRGAGGAIVTRATADAEGRFRMLAPAGRYDVLVDVRRVAFPRCKTASAEVRDGQMTNVDITCDSGMR